MSECADLKSISYRKNFLSRSWEQGSDRLKYWDVLGEVYSSPDSYRRIQILKAGAGGRSFEQAVPPISQAMSMKVADRPRSLSTMDVFIIFSLIMIVSGVLAVYIKPNKITGLVAPAGFLFLMIAGIRVRSRSHNF